MWRTQAQSFFSAGKDGLVLENDFADAQRPGDFANPVALDVAPCGDTALGGRTYEASIPSPRLR